MKKVLLLLLVLTYFVSKTNAQTFPWCGPLNTSSPLKLHSSFSSPFVTNVSMTGTALSNLNIPANAPTSGTSFGYRLFNDTATVLLCQSYTLNTTLSGAGSANVWIDWNQDGTFDPITEYTAIICTASSGASYTTTINVPCGATLGTTLMRIRSRVLTGCQNQSNGPQDACYATFGSGETQDYFINVIAGSPCTGVPVQGLPAITFIK